MFSLPFVRSKNYKIKPVVLVVMDGFGIAPPSEGNAIHNAKTPNYDNLVKKYAYTELIASGESVGLPANEVGNTEVGHITMGAGRVILQYLKKISLSIEKGRFFDNHAFLQAAAHVKTHNSKMHVMGLVGSGHVHSSLEHLYGVLQFCKKEEIDNVYLHLFTDGRDSPPKEGIEIIRRIEEHLKTIKIGTIASIAGRYYAMDRDRRWQRTEKAYKAITLAHAIQTVSAEDAVKSAYARGQTDEFIEPTVIAKESGPIATIDDNDAVIFYNFRIDRPKQLTMAFVMPDFENLKSFDFGYDPKTNIKVGEVDLDKTFKREKVPQNIFFVTMTEYQEDLPVSAVAFKPEQVVNPFSVILSKNGLKQMHMAESEKERFVKYYFDGLREEPSEGEESQIIPSPKVPTYDQKPEMSLPKLVSECIKQLKKDEFHFFIINFANPDMVGHTGDLAATIKAVENVDKHLKRLVDEVLARDGCLLVTGDHGNAEELLHFPNTTYFYTTAKGTVNTDHSNNPVPLVVINNEFGKRKVSLRKGSLADIAPTILNYMGIQAPAEMTGANLLAEYYTHENNKQENSGNLPGETSQLQVS